MIGILTQRLPRKSSWFFLGFFLTKEYASLISGKKSLPKRKEILGKGLSQAFRPIFVDRHGRRCRQISSWANLHGGNSRFGNNDGPDYEAARAQFRTETYEWKRSLPSILENQPRRFRLGRGTSLPAPSETTEVRKCALSCTDGEKGEKYRDSECGEKDFENCSILPASRGIVAYLI